MSNRSDREQPGEETLLLTVFLKHDQHKNLDEIQGLLGERAVGALSSARRRDVSWNVVMGIGQIVTCGYALDQRRQRRTRALGMGRFTPSSIHMRFRTGARTPHA